MDISRLRSFVAVVEQGTFSGAAHSLNLTQSTISLHVQALEEELGVTLFERLPRKSVLTRDGDLLLPAATELLIRHDQTVAEFALRQATDTGTVRVAASNSMILYYLPSRLQPFLAAWPAVEVTVLPARRDQMVSMVARREVDFALGARGPVSLGVTFTEIMRSDLLLITSLTHPLTALGRRKLTLDDVARYKLVMYPPDSAIRKTVDTAFESHGLTPHISIATGGAEILKRYVEIGMGVGFVSALSLREDDDQRLHIVNMRRFMPQRRYGIFTCHAERSLAARRLLDLMDPGRTL